MEIKLSTYAKRGKLGSQLGCQLVTDEALD